MKIDRKCPVCSATYKADTTRLKHGRQTTCSKDCSYILRANNLKNSVELTCACCETKFTRAISQIKGKHGSQFCSTACHYKGRALGKSKRIVEKPYNVTDAGRAAWLKGAKKARETRIKRDNYGHTEASKAKLREASCRAISEGRINTTSKLEEKVIPVLDSMGVEYVAQSPVRGSDGRFVCVFDFFIPVHCVVIEVNGTFWHSDSRFYPEGPVHAIQKHNSIRWERKLAEIDRLGYTLIELWEEDIKQRGEEYIRESLLSII